MKTVIPGATTAPPVPAKSSAAPSLSPQSGRLAQLASMMNRNSQVQAQRKAADEIQNSEHVQRQLALAAEINSSEPAQLNALACAQGASHPAPGQENHLPREARDIARQKQGRVKPTLQAKGIPVRDGALESGMAEARQAQEAGTLSFSGAPQPVQGVFTHKGKEYKKDSPKLPKIHKASEKDLKALADSSTNFGEIKTSADVARELLRLAPEEKKEIKVSIPAWRLELLDLIPHMAGEVNENDITGGHLWKAMEANFPSLKLVSGTKDDDNVWEGTWTDGIVGDAHAKRSTFFPAKWTVEDLTAQVRSASQVGPIIRLQPSDIAVQRKDKTFFPLKG